MDVILFHEGLALEFIRQCLFSLLGLKLCRLLFLLTSFLITLRLWCQIVILSHLVDFLDDLAHKRLLSEETNEGKPYSNKRPVEPSNRTQECQKVWHFSLVLIIDLVGSQVDTSYYRLGRVKELVLSDNILDLHKVNVDRLPILKKVIF